MILQLFALTLLAPLALQGSQQNANANAAASASAASAGPTEVKVRAAALRALAVVVNVASVNPDASTPTAPDVWRFNPELYPSYRPDTVRARPTRRGRIPNAAEFDGTFQPSLPVTQNALALAPAIPQQAALSEDLAKKLVQLQGVIDRHIRSKVTNPQSLNNISKDLVDGFLSAFKGLQSTPWSVTDITQLLQNLDMQAIPAHRSNSEQWVMAKSKDAALEALSAACIESMQAMTGNESGMKAANAELLRKVVANLSPTILEHLARTSIKRDPRLRQGARYGQIGLDADVFAGCKSIAHTTTLYRIICDALEALVVPTIAKTINFPRDLLPIIVGYYGSYHPALSLSGVHGYRHFGAVIPMPRYGAPPQRSRSNIVDLSHNGLTDLAGIAAIGQTDWAQDSGRGQLQDEVQILLFNCNHLAAVPSLQSFTACGIVNLSDNEITDIPKGTLPNAHTFLLAHNCLRSIPEDIVDRADILFADGPPGYEIAHLIIDVSGNPLLGIPAEVLKIQHLQQMGATVRISTPPSLQRALKPA